jgi:hypothetical protein
VPSTPWSWNHGLQNSTQSGNLNRFKMLCQAFFGEEDSLRVFILAAGRSNLLPFSQPCQGAAAMD